jgi:hypothetical protein
LIRSRSVGARFAPSFGPNWAKAAVDVIASAKAIATRLWTIMKDFFTFIIITAKVFVRFPRRTSFKRFFTSFFVMQQGLGYPDCAFLFLKN